MRMLLPSEYDEAYFEGSTGDYRHNAGYSDYQETFQLNLAQKIVNSYPNLVNQRIVDVGCAYGFLVKRLRDLGVDCWGRDISAYALSQADPSINPYLQEGSILDNYPASVKGIITTRTLVCFDEVTINQIVTHLNNTFGSRQLHILDLEGLNEKYYLSHDLNWWSSLPWTAGVRLVSFHNHNVEIIKV